MKKNLFLVAIAAVAMTSCSNEIDNVVNESASLKAIEFKPLVTRAGVVDATTTDIQTGGFAVSAFKGETLGSSTATAYMANVNVAFTTSWNYTGNYYWPIDGTDLFFFAHYQKGTGAIPAPTNASGVVTYADYVADGTKDLLLARTVDATSAAAVNIAFQHALSKVSFKVKNSAGTGLTVTVSSITVKAREKGSASWNTSGVLSWSVPTTSNEPVAHTFNLNTTDATDIVNGETTTNLATTEGSLMLMPQTLDDVVEVSVTYTIGGADSSTGTKTIPLTGNWDTNTSYVYVINFDAQAAVSFTLGAITEWETTTPADTTI